jgi:type II secretory ATPase GspE/PulE/Tfp pilus assembly ATPase PilB-like protein
MASALDIIIAQRLVRRICKNCKVKKDKTKEEVLVINQMLNDI